MAARGTNRGEVAVPTEASASARSDVNTSAVTRQRSGSFPVSRPLACLRPNGTEHRSAMMLMPNNPAATNTDTKRRVARQQHCVRPAGLSFSELPQPTLYRLYLFEVTRYCFIAVQHRRSNAQ